jgi:phosphoribosylanthranilate isomerase
LFHSIDYYRPNIIHFCEAFPDETALNMSGEALADLQFSIKERFPDIEIMRTIPVRAYRSDQSIPTFGVARCFEAASDYFLVDTSLGSEPVHGFVGITGHTCDWKVARKLIETTPLPVVLAGGLSPENVYEAIMEVRPFGVDSCTRTNAVDEEGGPIRFRKDTAAVRAFVEAVRQAEIDLSSGGNEPESPGGRKG